MSNIKKRLTMFTGVAVSTALAGLILMLTSSPTSAFILEPKGQSKSNDIKTSKGPVFTASSSLSSSDTSSSSVSKRSLSSSSNDPSVRHHENSILSGVWSPSGMWGFLPSSKKVVAAPPPSLHSQSSSSSIPSSFHKKSSSSSENSSTKKKAAPGDLFLDPVTLDEKSAFRHRNPIITNANAGSTVGAGSSRSSSLFHSESAPSSAGGSSNVHHPTPPPRPQYRLSPPKRLEPPLGNDIDNNRVLADEELMEILEEDAEPRDLLAPHDNDQHSSWATHLKRSSPAVVTRSFSDFNKRTRNYDIPQIECPPADDGMERFACPSTDRVGRYRCVDDHVLCDGFIDCPGKEDEDLQACMFYKTTKAHLDVLADALLRWARGKR